MATHGRVMLDTIPEWRRQLHRILGAEASIQAPLGATSVFTSRYQGRSVMVLETDRMRLLAMGIGAA